MSSSASSSAIARRFSGSLSTTATTFNPRRRSSAIAEALLEGTSETPSAREQERRLEPNTVCSAEGVERLQRGNAEFMGSTGVQGDVCVRLQLEPADHAEHALIGFARRQGGRVVPEMCAIERRDGRAIGARHRERLQYAFDVVLVMLDVVGHQPAEEVAPMNPVELRSGRAR